MNNQLLNDELSDVSLAARNEFEKLKRENEDQKNLNEDLNLVLNSANNSLQELMQEFDNQEEKKIELVREYDKRLKQKDIKIRSLKFLHRKKMTLIKKKCIKKINASITKSFDEFVGSSSKKRKLVKRSTEAPANI